MCITKMKYLKYIIVILIAIWFTNVKAQDVRVDAKLDTNVIVIGDQVDFKLKLQLPESLPFNWPLFSDTLPDKIEIVNKSKIDTTLIGDGFMNIEQTLTLTAFDTGYYVIRPLQFIYGKQDENAVETEPYLLNVFTVEVDTSLAIKPIKGPMLAPLTFAEIWPWLLAGILFVLLTAGLIYYLKKKKANQPIMVKKSKPSQPPHRTAFEELEKLKNEKLWQHDLVKEYHSRLTDILREYIEGTFSINSTEMTTWETIRAFTGVKIEKSALEKLREILELADLANFAKYKPLPEEHEKSMVDAEAFVKQTMNSQNETKMVNTSQEKITDKPEIINTEKDQTS